MNKGWIRLSLKPATSLPARDIGKRVVDSGITLDELRVEATGKLVGSRDGGTAFAVSGTGEIYPLVHNEKLEELLAASDAWTRAWRVTGQVRGSGPATPATQPAARPATQPTTQPATQPATRPSKKARKAKRRRRGREEPAPAPLVLEVESFRQEDG